MKNPRIEDFDPHAKIRPLGTPLDGMPAIQAQPRSTKPGENSEGKIVAPIPSPTENHQEPNQQKSKEENNPYAPSVRTPRTGSRRTILRHPFELYQDQIESLRELSVEERKQGGTGSMSKMVREALDAYIDKRKN
jgi:hypothetical protein